MKNTLVVISDPPSGQVAERLRMTVGLTLENDNKVTALLIDDGVYTGLGLDHEKLGAKEIDKHLKMLGMLSVEVFAHTGSCDKRGVTLDGFGIIGASDDDVAKLLEEADVTIA
ncbi:hypothetical protein MNBD_NITROSPINAE02-231 [hydrothermal vent metagenome]|uniref:Uncharacterized protein n=1 Tax=hydrothermal vent metagenome TaxID=652676 RepID=A0A3B1CJA9_9ZZZZ